MNEIYIHFRCIIISVLRVLFHPGIQFQPIFPCMKYIDDFTAVFSGVKFNKVLCVIVPLFVALFLDFKELLCQFGKSEIDANLILYHLTISMFVTFEIFYYMSINCLQTT